MNLDAGVTTPTEPIPPPQPSTLRKVFVGEDGIRAGWSLLIFLALFAGIALSANLIIHRLHPSFAKTPQAASEAMGKPRFMLIGEAIQFLLTFLVTWIMSKIERRPNSAYGFGGRRRLPNFMAGLGWGVVCLSLLVLTLSKTGLLVVDSRLLFGRDIVRYGAIWFIGFLFVGCSRST